MQCDRARELIGAYLDEELSGADRSAVCEHLRSCALCREDANASARLSQQIAMEAQVALPGDLERNVRAALATGIKTQTAVAKGQVASYSGVVLRPLIRQAAAIAAACILSAGVTWLALTASAATGRLERDVVTAHIRSLLQDSPIQVASSDQHTVKPWFAGRVDFSPEVKDLTAEGFPLSGARLDYIGDRRVGALVYRRRLHVVNVFIWPAANADPSPLRMSSIKGYNLASWSKGGVTYWAVSDLNSGELQQLQSLM